MGLNRIFLVLLCVIGVNTYGNQSLRVLHPDLFQGYQGSIKEAKVYCRPLGVYMQVDLFLTFSSGEYPLWTIPSDEQLEIIYEFDLPEDAIIVESWLWMDGQPIPAKIKDLRTAVTEYEGQIDRKKDPSIMLKKGPTEYELRVYPLLAAENETREVKISYLTPVIWTEDFVSTFVPADAFPSFDAIENIEVLMFKDEEWVDPILNYNPLTPSTEGSFQIKGAFTKFELSSVDLGEGLWMSYSNPAEDGYYLNRQRTSKDLGVYELAVIPSLVVSDVKTRNITVGLDFEPENGLTAKDYLTQVEAALELALDSTDMFVLELGNGGSSPFLQAKDELISQAILGIDTMLFYDQHTDDILQSISDRNLNNDHDEILLISNSSYFDSEFGNNQLIGLGSALTSIPFSVVDVSVGGNAFWIDGIQHKGHNMFYESMTSQTGGELYQSGNLVTGVLTALNTSEISFSGFSVQSDVSSGGNAYFIHEVGTSGLQYYDQAYMEVGWYRKDSTFEVDVIVENGEEGLSFYYNEIEDSISDNPNDSMIVKMWTLHEILELTPDVGVDPEVEDQIIKYSLEEQILTPFTAFLALPPDDSDTIVCAHCVEDEQVVGIPNIPSDEFLLYPTYVNKQIQIQTERTGYHIQIYNTLGNLVYEGEDETMLELGHLTSGYYEVIISTTNSIFRYRIFKE